MAIAYGSVTFPSFSFPFLVWELQVALANTLHLVKAVGNIIGPQFFLDSQKPYYTLGIGAMIFSFSIMAFCGKLYWSVFARTIHSDIRV